MKPPGHAAISLAIGGVLWAVTKSPYSLPAAFVTGVMIDLDHLVEYYFWFVKEDSSRVWYFLHSYELLAPALLASYLSGWDPVAMGVSFAFLGHLLTDQIVNPVRPLTYFFTYRAFKRFRMVEVLDVEWKDLRQDILSRPGTDTVLGILKTTLRFRK